MAHGFEDEIRSSFVAEFGRAPEDDEIEDYEWEWWGARYVEEHGRGPDAQQLHDFIMDFEIQEMLKNQ